MTATPKIFALVLAGLLVLPLPVLAKRTPAPVVAPVVYEGVRYTVPNDKGTVGYVVAWDVATGKQLWKKTIFRKWICPLFEHDVQWVFIKQMRLDGRRLILVNERGKFYALDLKTRRVKKLKEQPRAPASVESNWEPFPSIPPADADPSIRHAVPVRVSTDMQVVRHGDALTVVFSNFVTTNLMVGHKMVTGITREDRVYRDGVAQPRGMSLQGGFAFEPSTNVLTLGRDGLPVGRDLGTVGAGPQHNPPVQACLVVA